MDSKAGSDASRLPVAHRRRVDNTRVNRRAPRLFKYLSLLVAAAILSTLLPASWLTLRIRDVIVAPSGLRTQGEWRDDTWPIREQTPWDISTDFPYPRRLEYDVEEGTWLRLDVHPTTGDIVFDMVGDLYCIPGSSYAAHGSNLRASALPVTRGIPHDADPHFSPKGDQIVFRSDAGLGVDNIWVTPWTGCESMSLTKFNTEDSGGAQYGVPETLKQRTDRLLGEGRLDARRVTNETFRPVTDPRFHPSGSKIIATKWFTSFRSLGAGTGWEYDIPNDTKRIKAGSGNLLVDRSLPFGWSPEELGEQQIGPEQLIWAADDVLIYSKNVVDENAFEYSKDVHKGIYAIFSHNVTSKETTRIVDAFPGGASRPELSRDRRTLAFVRRFRDYEALVLKDLQSGTIRHIWNGLTYDLSNIAAPMGTYPSFAFTPDDSAIIIWAAGQIYHVPLSVNDLGEKTAGGTPHPIKFRAHIEKRVAKTLKLDPEFDLAGLETADSQRVHAFKHLRVDFAGKTAVFEAGGKTVIQAIGESDITHIPTLYDDEVTPYYSPSFIPSTGDLPLIIHARWSDQNLTAFEISDTNRGNAYEISGLPLGRYRSPVVSEGDGKQRRIAFVKSSGSALSGDIVATAKPGLYIGFLTLDAPYEIEQLQHVPFELDPDGFLEFRFLDGHSQLLIQQESRAFIIDLDGELDKTGKPPHYTLATGKTSTQIAVLPSLSSATSLSRLLSGKTDTRYSAQEVAFIDFFHVYLAEGKDIKDGEPVWSKVGNSTRGLTRLSLDGGHDITWSGDGKKLFWFLGPYLHSVEVAKLKECSKDIEKDRVTFGISCVKKILQYQEVIVSHSTDISRLKAESRSGPLAIFNATLLTMETGVLERDLIRNAVLLVEDGVIKQAGSSKDVIVPEYATAINAEGGFIVPGFIDAHAHWDGFADLFPVKSWEMETFLAYGVTTLQNPSNYNVEGFAERSRLERGQFIGPRIFHTGSVIYGAGIPGHHLDIVDMDEAYSALIRIKAEGGDVSTSYKNYNLPIRASRQRLLLAARNLSMLCVPEGGMNYDWDITYIVDGMTTIEHAIPIPVLYDDVLLLFAHSGTGSTPTHIVNYGGVMGEQLLWATEEIPNDPKLRRFVPHDILESLTETTSRPLTSFQFFNTSISTAKMVRKGLKAHIGAHGEHPKGLIYHAELEFTQAGGLDTYEVLQAATSSAAQTFGIFSSVGSLSPGKLADFLVYPPDVDFVDGPITQSRDIKYVARGGRIWDAETMEQVWPVKKPRQEMPKFNSDT